MTFRQFAFNNVKRNARQYMSYFFSCMFSVAVFFIYAVIMFHPEIDGHEFREGVQRGIMAAEIIIFGFSFLFVMYSTGAFIKSRKKEYGLLMTLGISKSKLNRMLILENTIIGVVSILAGILVGMLFANLFIMGFSKILELEGTLGFHIAPKAIIITVISYFLMFEFNSIFVVWTLKTNAVVDLLRGVKANKRPPKFSWVLSILGLALVIVAYYLAATSTLITIVYRMFYILLLIIPGTYLLFTQFSVAFIYLLKRRRNLYFHKTNLLTISDLSYKLKDHARLLFFVTILSAVAFTASGVLFGAFKSAEAEANAYYPQDVSFLAKGEDNIAMMDKEMDTVLQKFEQANINYQSITVNRTQAQLENLGEMNWADLISFSDYQQIADLNQYSSKQSIKEDQMYIMLPNIVLPGEADFPEELTVSSNNFQAVLNVDTITSVINTTIHTRYTIVVPDQIFDEFANVADPNEQYRYTAMNVPNWTNQADQIVEIMKHVNNDIVEIDASADFYVMMKKTLAHTLFFGLFISVLFFLAAGSILYFKLYQDLDKDISKYKALYRIGLTRKEMKASITQEIAYLFFIPFTVAVIHAGFAFKALQNMLSASVLWPSVMLISCYLAIYAVYFFFIRGLYISKIKHIL